MKKLGINKLSLKTFALPLLSLSLIVGCTGLFCGSASAATANASFIPYMIPGSDGSSLPPAQGEWSHDTAAEPHHTGSYKVSTDVPICSTATISNARISFEVKNTQSTVTYGDDGIMAMAFNTSDNQTFYPLGTIHSGSPFSMWGSDAAARGFTTGLDNNGLIDFDVPLANISPLDLSNSLGLFILYEYGDPFIFQTTYPTLTLTYDDSSCPVISPSPDTSTTLPSTPVTINVLGNDGGSNLKVSKIDGQDIVIGQTITLTNGSGTVKLNTDGTITFTPTSTFTGESSFSYSITDGTSTVDNGTVKVTVASATAPEPVTPSQNNPTSTTKTNTASTKPMLANTGENARSLMIVFTTLLVLASYFKFKNKGAQEYRR